MARRGSSARAAALRRAQQAKAARDAARLRREKDIEAALADYFEATEQAERIRAEARRKADRLRHRRGTGRGNPAAGRHRGGPPAAGPDRHGHGSGVLVRDQCGRGPGRARQAGNSVAGRRGCRSARPHRPGIRWPSDTTRQPAQALHQRSRPVDVPGHGPGQVADTAGDDERG